MNPLTVCLFDITTSMVDTQFLDRCCTTGQTSGTAATIFPKIDDVMTKRQPPWSNCAGFSLDNTSANLGVCNSIKARIILKI